MKSYMVLTCREDYEQEDPVYDYHFLKAENMDEAYTKVIEKFICNCEGEDIESYFEDGEIPFDGSLEEVSIAEISSYKKVNLKEIEDDINKKYEEYKRNPKPKEPKYSEKQLKEIEQLKELKEKYPNV